MVDKQLVRILKNIAVMLDIKGENPFKSRAYRNAAEKIVSEDIDVKEAVKNNTLAGIKGFGKALQAKITDYVENGSMEYYEKLRQDIPESVLEITRIASVGPKKGALLFNKLGIKNLDELEEACDTDKVASLKGFGKKSQEMILSGILHKRANRGRVLQEKAEKISGELLDLLKNDPEIEKIEITGEYRRFSETVSKIRFIFSGKLNEKLLYDKYAEFLDNVLVGDELKIEFIRSTREEFYSKLHETTGGKEYIEAFNKLFINKNVENPESEKALYLAAGIQFIEPELRENPGIISLAKEYKIPKLIDYSDLRGMVHCHSDWSDGKNSIKEMALASKELGFEYFALCDHSKSAVYANGLTEKRVILQHEEIDKLNNEGLGIKIIKGIESDILSDGSLDYDEATLCRFDMVVASVHSSFRMSKQDMTRRIICALKSPYTTMLGHPTGRLLLVRQPYEVDIKQVIDCASDYGKVIEINSNPYRLDISWEWAAYAREKGVRLSINPDSHRVSTLNEVRFGVRAARKAMIESENVVNCLSFEDFMELVANNK